MALLLVSAVVAVQARAGTFGTVIATGGQISDIALDERRGLLYLANLGGNRIDVLSTSDLKLREPIRDIAEPASIAMSADGRYLAVAHLYASDYSTNQSRVTMIDLDAGARRPFAVVPGRGLAIAFGNSPRALLATTSGFYMIDPVSGEIVRRPDPVPTMTEAPALTPELKGCLFGTAPTQIIQASAAVSGDGNVVRILASVAPPDKPDCKEKLPGDDATLLAKYDFRKDEFTYIAVTAAPRLGPRTISTDRYGEKVLAGWALLDARNYLLAQFPRATGEYTRGGYALDFTRNLIFGDLPDTAFTPAKDGFGTTLGLTEPVLHVFAADNLAVVERLKLAEGLSGKAIFNRAVDRMYAISQSGVTVFPIGDYDRLPRLVANKEDVLFRGNGCSTQMLTGDVDIVDPNGRELPFSLKIADGVRGVRLISSGETTPARVRIEIDPMVFQERKGTTSVLVELRSPAAMNIPLPIRLLVNTRDPEQRGTILNVPGSIVDILADPWRDRAYLLRQDKNEVLVYDTIKESVIARLRTGNTPVGMAITPTGERLLVANDNSGVINVFELDTLQTLAPIVAPLGYYPRTIAALHGAIWATARTASGKPEGVLLRIDTGGGVALPPERLGVYKNDIKKDAALAASPSGYVMFMASPDGTVVRYESQYNGFSAARLDYSALSGGYGVISDDLFAVGSQLLNRSLVPIRRLDGDGTSSGFAFSGGDGYRTFSKLATGPGVIEKIQLERFTSIVPTATAEAPSVSDSLKYPAIGQIGQTILPFTRTIAPLRDGKSVLVQTISGITRLPANFDAPIASPAVTGLINMADGTSAVAPGALVRVQGRNLTERSDSAAGAPYPTSLGDVCVSVNSVPMPMFRIDAGEIRGQLPNTVSGPATLVVRTAGGSSTLQFNAMSSAPAVFRSGTAGDLVDLPMVYRAANSELVTGTNPVRMNDTLVIYGTGIGRTAPAVPDGAAADTAAVASELPQVTLGGIPLRVDFAGLVPGFVGLSQINVTVPSNVPEGVQVPLRIRAGAYETSMNVRMVKP